MSRRKNRKVAIVGMETIDCRGQSHRLAYDGKNLLFLDHDNIREEKIARALGDKTCGCLRAAEWFAGHEFMPFSGVMFDIVKRLAEKYAKKRSARFVGALSIPFAVTSRTVSEKVAARIDVGINVARGILRELYPHDRVAIYSSALLSRSVRYHLSLSWPEAGGAAAPGVPFPATWLEKVHKKGLAVVDGHFVIDRLTPEMVEHARWRRPLNHRFTAWWDGYGACPTPERVIVLALRRPASGQGYLYPFPAEVIGEGGSARLVWLSSGTQEWQE